MHLEHLADALLLTLDGVENLIALRNLTRVNTHVRELAIEGMNRNLEGQSRERFLLRSVTLEVLALFLVAGLEALHGLDINRGREEVDDAVEQGLDALVLVSRTGENRVDLGGDGTNTHALDDLFGA